MLVRSVEEMRLCLGEGVLVSALIRVAMEVKPEGKARRAHDEFLSSEADGFPAIIRTRVSRWILFDGNKTALLRISLFVAFSSRVAPLQ